MVGRGAQTARPRLPSKSQPQPEPAPPCCQNGERSFPSSALPSRKLPLSSWPYIPLRESLEGQPAEIWFSTRVSLWLSSCQVPSGQEYSIPTSWYVVKRSLPVTPTPVSFSNPLTVRWYFARHGGGTGETTRESGLITIGPDKRGSLYQFHFSLERQIASPALPRTRQT